ncbi:hypothetical protein [Planococcus maitriensis]|uniref:Uncharacterized protein n=1 Tax=Planococcus maitriensis TaxID=221799 RepID=A0A365KA19_9BACL|nr:hypothetical protein [Planococcus maitriensis]RAZ69619.1 hypothetical protein DP119_02885 [Planococcus maitriensis]
MAIMLSACSNSNEVIRVGVPFTDGLTQGVHYQKDIKDRASIVTLRTILQNEKEFDSLDRLAVEPQAVFTIDRPDDGVQEVRRFVWYRDSGRAIMSNERNVLSPKENQEFFRLTAEQTQDLKKILQ